MDKNYYVYAYLNPLKSYFNSEFSNIKFEPFYIGRGKGDRQFAHLHEAKKFRGIKFEGIKFEIIKKYRLNMLKINTINKIINEGKTPIIIKLVENLTLDESKKIETEFISKFGKIWISTGILTNITDGGEGQSRIHVGSLNPFYGHTHTEKNKKIISQRFKGRPLSKEHKLKISKTLKNKPKSHIAKEKYRESMRRRYIENPNQKMFKGLGERRQKTYEIENPFGEKMIIISLRAFCLDNGLNTKTLKSAFLKNMPVMSGPSKGWRILKEI